MSSPYIGMWKCFFNYVNTASTFTLSSTLSRTPVGPVALQVALQWTFALSLCLTLRVDYDCLGNVDSARV